MQPEELSSETQRSPTRDSADEEKTNSTYEEVIRRIKDATGVTDVKV